MRRIRAYLYSIVVLLRNGYFWAGIAILALIGGTLYLVVDRVLMPEYTRFGVSVTVPNVLNLSVEDAQSRLSVDGLGMDQQILRKPNLPKDVVIDQIPDAGSLVKPGRRIFVTVNTGDTTTVRVPKVIGYSVREASNRMVVLGLQVASVRPDSTPSSHPNTVTRQSPRPGRRSPIGTDVILWYSTGLGNAFVVVPELIGLKVSDGQRRLNGARLRGVILGETTEEDPIILEQSPAAGTTVREGFEIRLRVRSGDG